MRDPNYIPSRTSPKGGRRGCLCWDTATYSISCCDGSVRAQGIGLLIDTDPPVGYTISWNQDVLDFQNYTSASFNVGNGQAFAYVYYTVTDGQGGEVIGNYDMGNDTDVDVPVDVSSLADGTLTLSAYLADPNEGVTITDTVSKIVETSEYVYALQGRMDEFEGEDCVYAALNELVAIEIS